MWQGAADTPAPTAAGAAREPKGPGQEHSLAARQKRSWGKIRQQCMTAVFLHRAAASSFAGSPLLDHILKFPRH